MTADNNKKKKDNKNKSLTKKELENIVNITHQDNLKLTGMLMTILDQVYHEYALEFIVPEHIETWYKERSKERTANIENYIKTNFSDVVQEQMFNVLKKRFK
jgi:hypothetical protein